MTDVTDQESRDVPWWRDRGNLVGGGVFVAVVALLGVVLVASGLGLLEILTGLAWVAGGVVAWQAGLLALYAAFPARRTRWRRRRTITAAARRHPGAVLVPGYAGKGMYDQADERGVLPRSWRRAWQNERQMVLAVLPDRVEVWVHGAKEPLWSVRRVEQGVRIERTTVQSDYEHDVDRDEVWFDDGTASAGIAPEYAVRLLVLRNYEALDLERALREIGLSPSDVPRRDSGGPRETERDRGGE